ncbi:SPOR domain-containing protein [Fibrobacter sp. UBA4297]|uniref:SPOR domain-containing protein n=1 Tax=Fibrobacter sp. UBA4297 TaxID=1946536 RepID=UPI0025BAB758|nr:SPOR domain-containing protein [Fibrobacter sp. UBA4297]
MAKYFIHNLVITGALCAFATTASFAEATPTLATAQKAYVNGNWKVAAAAYEQVCPNEPENTRTECYLWNVLALSQTGIAADFSKAGKRLDSLIDKTNPQQAIYADLMMTKAQFQMYLGRYNKAAESLVHAIETSQPHQVTVLQKVCVAVQDRAHSEDLNEACKNLGNPEALKQAAAKREQAQAEQVKAEQATSAAPQASTTPSSNNDAAKAAESKASAPATTVAAAEPAQTKAPEAKPAEAKSAWQLQLGAFGVKSNADLLVDNLKKRNIACTISQNTLESGKVLYIVRTGPFDTKERAVDYGAKKLAPLNVEFRPMLVKQAL